jgi:hypothetical protein
MVIALSLLISRASRLGGTIAWPGGADNPGAREFEVNDFFIISGQYAAPHLLAAG